MIWSTLCPDQKLFRPMDNGLRAWLLWRLGICTSWLRICCRISKLFSWAMSGRSWAVRRECHSSGKYLFIILNWWFTRQVGEFVLLRTWGNHKVYTFRNYIVSWRSQYMSQTETAQSLQYKYTLCNESGHIRYVAGFMAAVSKPHWRLNWSNEACSCLSVSYSQLLFFKLAL